MTCAMNNTRIIAYTVREVVRRTGRRKANAAIIMAWG